MLPILLIASVLSTLPAAAQAIQIAPEQKRQQALQHYRAGQTRGTRKSGTMRLQSLRRPPIPPPVAAARVLRDWSVTHGT